MPDRSAIRIQPLKKKVRVTVDRAGVAGQKQANWLSDWAMQAEIDGCVAPGEGQRLAARIVESVPLEPPAAFRLVHANGVQSGYVDLGPETRVEVIAPLLRPSGTLTAPAKIEKISGTDGSITVDLAAPADLIGIERAWYGVEAKPGSDGYRVTLVSTERRVNGTVEQVAAPQANYLSFAPEAAFYRLFYKIDATGVIAIAIAGKTRQELETRTKKIGADPAACEGEPGMCLVLPKKLGINPFLVVNANGTDVAVPLGSTVRAVLLASKVAKPEAIASQLTIRRLYGGRPELVEFDRSQTDILGLTLMGLERITW
jgi:hypothetical protein